MRFAHKLLTPRRAFASIFDLAASRRQSRHACLVACLACLPAFHGASTHASAALPVVLDSSNRAPFAQVLGLPVAEDLHDLRAQLANRERGTRWRLSLSSYSLSSQSVVRNPDDSPREQILVDGETTRLEANALLRTGKRSAISISVPFIAHHSGNADQAIEQWHKVFGLPNSNRGLREQDLLEFSYSREGTEVFRLDRNVSGVGDLQFAWLRLLGSERSSVSKSLRAGLKTPFASEAKLFGTGSLSAYVDFSAAGALAMQSRWRWQASGGLLWSEGGGVLAGLRRSVVPYGSVSLARGMGNAWQLHAQLESHGRLYRSETNELRRVGLQLALGASRRLGANTSVSFYFTEDLVTRSSPDFGLGASLRFSPAVEQ